MGKITKTMQHKHKETLTPWLKNYVQTVASAPLPRIPQHLEEFPTRWPFPRGDLYHWIPLLNRFDNILESVSSTYSLGDAPQCREFGCDVLLKKGASVDYHDDHLWDQAELGKLGYREDGDSQLLVAILKFSSMLLEHCGNRSIYASSAHLNDLLHSTSLTVVEAALDVGQQLAQRYQASVKRMGVQSRQLSSALLANHYNIDLDRVHLLAQPFVKTPIVNFAPDPLHMTTPTPGSKGKEKMPSAPIRNVASMYANDLVSIATPEQHDEGRWNGWGDVKVTYLPKAPDGQETTTPDQGHSSMPQTPTPLRRSTTGPTHRTPRSERSGSGSADDGSSPTSQTRYSAFGGDDITNTSQKHFELPQSALLSSTIYELLARCPSDMPKASQYELLNRLRISKALLESPETRQLALAVRLMAITNLSYIQPEHTFVEKVLKQDNDEPRRYQLVYQLAELIHPSTVGASIMPLWLQSIALQLLEGISNYPTKYPDVLSALNANVNHGVLLYVIRKAVAEIKDDQPDTNDRATVADEWRNHLFSLALHMTIGGNRVGSDMISAGLMESLVEILNIRSRVAERNTSMVVAFLDGVVYNLQGSFQAFISAHGLDSMSQLIIDTSAAATTLASSDKGTKSEYQSTVVDYDIPFYQQQTLKWLLKFTHHIMTNSYTFGGNTDRLLRNLVDNSQLLRSLCNIIENMKLFGSVVWTNAVTILGDFINNDPTSFAAIAESGMIRSFLESVTGGPIVAGKENEVNEQNGDDANGNGHDGNPSSPDSDDSVIFDADNRQHPPTEADLERPRDGPLARGILPSSEAINIIPTILNSISLNNTGMKMVVASRAFDKYFEIFESPAHVHCMEVDVELAHSIGSSFDELARHHPSLRPAIANAVVDMVARVSSFGRQKALSAGWGAKIQVPQTASSRKGKEKASAVEDVEMVDAGEETEPLAASAATSAVQPSTAATYNEITPYINAVATFLIQYLSNSNLKSAFVQNGGTELVLGLCELPSLPYDFTESAAARTLQHVVSQLVEQSPILGMPSLLKRTLNAVDELTPLLHRNTSESFFAPFLRSGDTWGSEQGLQDKALEATKVVKALLNAQSLLKTLSSCFPFSNRQGSHTLHPVNVFDYYTQLVKSLGSLLRVVLTEEMGIANVVPKNWSMKGSDRSHESSIAAPTANPPNAAEGDESSLQDALSTNLDGTTGDDALAARPKKPTQQEQVSAAFQNFQQLRLLLHSFMPTTFPFFQCLGKALLPRRQKEPYQRYHHLLLAEALAETIMDHLSIGEEATTTDYHYCIVMLHTLHEMLVDPTRVSNERPTVHVIIPVLLAFKERGGLDSLNTMLRVFSKDMNKDDQDGNDDTKSKLAALGLKKILELYSILVNGKNIIDSVGLVEISPRAADRPSSQVGSQLLVELRMAIFPIVRGLWESGVVEKMSTPILSRVVEILKTVAAADQEGSAHRRSDKTPPPKLYSRDPVPFNWSAVRRTVDELSERDGNDEDLAREAVYRSQGLKESALEYCRADKARVMTERHPIPAEDAFQLTPSPEQNRSKSQTPALAGSGLLPPEAMVLDPGPDLDRLINDVNDAVMGELVEHSSQASSEREQDTSSQTLEAQDANGTSFAPANGEQDTAITDGQDDLSELSTGRVTKEDLDEERAKLQVDLIDRCLDVIRAHPDSVYEVSDLISATVLKSQSDDGRQEVGETLVNALMSFAIDDETKKSSARSIAAYAHLLSMLLKESEPFYRCAVKTLKDNIGDYIGFLKVPSGVAIEELPPWIPYILLIFEILLVDDEQPVDVKWKAPTSENDTVEDPVFQVRDLAVGEEDRQNLLDAILEIMPRIGKEEIVAVAVLRILVVLTRVRSVAKTLGEKKNLQRLFVMTKQLAGIGSARFKDTRIGANVLTILRHIVEDDDVIRQMMRSEIRNYFEMPQRGSRPNEVNTYLRQLSHVALRAPDLFVEVSDEVVKFSSRWAPPSSDGSYRPTQTLALKELPIVTLPTTTSKDDSVGPAVQATEDLNINDVRPSTETGDKEMIDIPKTPAQEHRRPIVENPDGVIHFLLEQLLNYQKVDDTDKSLVLREGKPSGQGASLTPVEAVPIAGNETTSSPSESKDKKPSKPSFKADEHPIFILRCFLLHCLTELLQSYNRTKIEFINFKRGASLQTNTPVKPRSTVLNYLLNDLLCMNSLSSPVDSLTAKKKVAISEQARLVLVALVTKTGEKTVDRTRDKYEFDDEPDLLYVRKFVLDIILKAYKDASTPNEPFDARYAKMLSLAELMNHMTGEKDKEAMGHRATDTSTTRSQCQLRRLMYEKGYMATITASIADIDLTFPGVKRTIKYILRVLRVLTSTATQLSRSNLIHLTSLEDLEAEIASASSLSDLEDDREETPDLYRNSALGMLEPREEGDFSEDSEEGDEDMYDDQYDEELEYGDEMSADEDNVSDEDEDLAEMGEVEGLPGDHGVVEVIMGEDDDEDDSMDDDEESSDEDDSDEIGSEDMEEIEEIIDEEGNPMEDDGASGWENESSEDGDEAEEVDYEEEAQDLDEMHVLGHDHTLPPISRLVRAMAAAEDPEFDGDDIGNFDEQRYIDDGGDEDDEDDDEEEMEDEEYIYDQDYPHDEPPPPNMPAGLGWDTMVIDHGGQAMTGHRHRHGGMRSPFPSFMFNSPRDPLSDFRNYFRPRAGPSNTPDDGVNPLLRRNSGPARESSPRSGGGSSVVRLGFQGILGNVDSPLALLSDLITQMPGLSRPGQALHFQITQEGPRGEVREVNIPYSAGAQRGRDVRSENRRENYHEPHQAVAFTAVSTNERWLDEAKMIFGSNHADKTAKAFSPRILAKLTPAAIQQAREEKAKQEELDRKVAEEKKKREEEERKQREAKEAEEKAAREKKEAEEREQAEREAAEAAAEAAEAAAQAAAEAAQDDTTDAVEGSEAQDQPMSGVEQTGADADGDEGQQGTIPAEEAERVMTTIRGEQIDITGLGIDPDYLAALPEEFREEVIAGTLTARRSEARQQAASTGEQSETFNEFLDALPEDLRLEIMQQERQEQRRRQREEERRQATASGQDPAPQDMDPASILLTFPQALREQVLLEQGEELIDHLPPEMVAEARAIQDRHRPPQSMPRAREAARNAVTSATTDNKIERRSVVQMLDKAGIATLLRLMFIAQQGSIRYCLFSVFADVCENRQNRVEVVSTLLQILQDGSTDMEAVERSFGQLSLKAKQPKEKESKTPNSLKRTFTNISTSAHPQTNSEISPLLIVQQCLDLLVELSGKDLHIPSLFLTEHEAVGSSLKRTISRKGKNRDAKANKYAINSLLSLLDRDLVMESSSVMQLLADLLNKITYPLQAIERRRKEILEQEKKAAEKQETSEVVASGNAETASPEPVTTTAATIEPNETPSAAETQADSAGAEAGAEAGAVTEAGTSKASEPKEPETKKPRPIQPPVIPTHNLTLVINIFVARECSSKTFQNTISTIKNLSNIPEAKATFGQELVRQARKLSEDIVKDLDDLLPHILNAKTGTDIQGVALAKFSPGASEQNKLLRVLTALDHLFDSKGKKGEDDDVSAKEEFLSSLYHNETFGIMWERLSECLSAIRKRENMLNVATILLPLIESLMVVCKNTTIDDAPLAQSQIPQSQGGKDMVLSSPPPESRIAGLFYTFTEDHRRILNELVRHNPKLMSGTFSLLVKNPAVLEFDNKRNYFNRSVHSKSNNQSRPSFPPLQLSVRREQVFHDSFRSLYFKSGDEMKYGKLSIRFHGEEGVDAGGVTREWFQVLARQMFDANYALFIPVSSDRTTFHPNKLSGINDEHLMFFKFIGRVIGKALYEGRLLDCYFSRAVYKRILGKTVSVKDMESFDPDYYKSLVWMLQNDITDIITETFSVDDDEFGVITTVDLCKNGRNIPVTEDNKHEYVGLMVQHKLLNSVKEQMEHFLKGFHEIIPSELIKIFNEQELELLISGLPDIDVDDWKGNTEYHNYTASSQQIQWFWRAVRSFDKEERAKLLQFVTGTSKVPLNGFKELEGMNGINRFNIHRDYGNKDRLPSSHTCFNQLDLPEYESYETLRGQVLKAITAGNDYFGFA